jgi:hypothetical protein
MGLLDRLRGRTTPRQTTAITVHAGDLVEVVGESYRQGALQRVAAITTDGVPFLDELSGRPRKIAEEEDRRWFRAVLFCELGNEHDPNAIAVHADGVGHIGYLSRDDAVDYQPVFAALAGRGYCVASCPAFLIGGEPGKPTYGALLCLSSPDRVIQDLQETLAE